MLTARERDALRRMQETVELARSARWDPWHRVIERGRGRWRRTCGGGVYAMERQGTVRVSPSDLRLGFVRDLCPACAKALGLKGEGNATRRDGD